MAAELEQLHSAAAVLSRSCRDWEWVVMPPFAGWLTATKQADLVAVEQFLSAVEGRYQLADLKAGLLKP